MRNTRNPTPPSPAFFPQYIHTQTNTHTHTRNTQTHTDTHTYTDNTHNTHVYAHARRLAEVRPVPSWHPPLAVHAAAALHGQQQRQQRQGHASGSGEQPSGEIGAGAAG